MRITRNKEGTLCITLSPVSYTFYEGGCNYCGTGKGRIWNHLPITVNVPGLYFNGHLCEVCEKRLNTSRNAVKRFSKLWSVRYGL